ncbi:hypothetical protein [Streptomyces finlayi]|nr:hypothetical protein [Streptomyces finlayi]
MSSMSGSSRRALAWVNDRPWIYAAVVWVVAVLVLASVDLQSEWLDSLVMGCLSGSGAVVGTLYLSRADRRAANVSKVQLGRMENWLKKGLVPSAAEDREAMRTLVARHGTRLERRRRALPVFGVIGAGFCVLAFLVFDPLIGLGAVALVVLLGWAEVREVRRTRARLEHMHRALGESAGPDSSES